MTDGTVMGQESSGTHWYQLKPDGQGNYASGTWSAINPMHDSRLYFASVVLGDGRVFVAGAEYGTGSQSVEIYDPRRKTWRRVPGFNSDIGDSAAVTLPDGRVLLYPRLSATGSIFDPTTGMWTTTSSKFFLDKNDEESVVPLPDGSYLSVDVFHANTAQKYIPSSDTWVSAGTTPSLLVDTASEIGPGVLLYDGKALFLGATGKTALYTPASDPLAPGSWQAGPDIPNGKVSDDGPAAVMPNGKVLFATSSGHWATPSALFEYDPASNSFVSVAAPWPSDTTTPIYVHRMLLLPTGQVLMTDGGGNGALYTPSSAAMSAFKPVITSIVDRHDGTFRLDGQHLNGFTGGAYYGDDAQMASNYPLVRLTAGTSAVFYARTYNPTTLGVATAAGGVSFAVPGIPPGTYSLEAIGNGLASNAAAFTITATTAQCNDIVKNGNETDVDCGGSCVACIDGRSCTANADCASAVCQAGKCGIPSCTDGILNNNESSMDCGGANCSGCLVGDSCRIASDCASGQGVCLFGKCDKSYCADRTRDFDETDVDCGGPNCAPCKLAAACKVARDCQVGQGLCLFGKCSKDYCSDHQRDLDERGVDCGGPNCLACAAGTIGATCRTSHDCLTGQGQCLFGSCNNDYCTDGRLDFDETGVDCGGSCPACPAP